MLRATAMERKVKLAIISEPPKHIGGGRWYASTDHRAAFLIFDREVPAKLVGRGRGWVTAMVGSTLYVSCYHLPNKAYREFTSYIAELKRKHQRGDGTCETRTIIAGDLNAWSTAWGSGREDRKGKHLREPMEEMGLEVCNKGNAPTFQAGGHESVIDVTFATHEIAGAIKESWQVEDTETLSDHRYVTYAEPPEVTNHRKSTQRTPEQETGWSLRKLDRDKFRKKILETTTNEMEAEDETPETMAAKLCARFTSACKASAPPRVGRGNKKRVHWWNKEVAAARQKCNAARRKLQRSRTKNHRDGPPATPDAAAYKDAKKHLRLTIRPSKERAWRELVESIEKDPWGMPYKICMAKLKPKDTHHTTVVRQAVKDLFPNGQELSQRPQQADAGSDPPELITEAEVAKAVKASKSGKAPGPTNCRTK